MPLGVPPLTPGTDKRVNNLLKESFTSWDIEAQNRNISKGKLNDSIGNMIKMFAKCFVEFDEIFRFFSNELKTSPINSIFLSVDLILKISFT